MNTKFLRGLEVNIPTGNSYAGSLLFHAKLLYEFWGFCVNGSNDLRQPSGFATISGTLAPNYIKMPANFESGSSVLLASGSDGSTVYGSNIFSAPSVNWTSGSLVGKYLVTWKSGSTSTDDSIYPITRVVSSSSIQVDVTLGGTPMSQSMNEIRFDERNSINFRVVDISAASQLSGFVASDHMVFQFSASDINEGQANSQLYLRLSNGSLSHSQFLLNCSPSGSWNGTTFSDLGATLQSESLPIAEYSYIEPYDFVNLAGGIHQISIFADKAGIIMHKNQSSLGGSARAGSPSFFHVEIPIRLFPQNKDPNPIAYVCVSRKGISTRINYSEAIEGANYAHGWQVPNFAEGTTSRKHSLLCRNLYGFVHSSPGMYSSGYAANLIAERFKQTFYNTLNRTFIIQDLILAQTRSSTSFTLGRVQLRMIKLFSGEAQRHTKLGQNGQWIAVKDGILYPWDNAQLPRNLFIYGA